MDVDVGFTRPARVDRDPEQATLDAAADAGDGQDRGGRPGARPQLDRAAQLLDQQQPRVGQERHPHRGGEHVDLGPVGEVGREHHAGRERAREQHRECHHEPGTADHGEPPAASPRDETSRGSGERAEHYAALGPRKSRRMRTSPHPIIRVEIATGTATG